MPIRAELDHRNIRRLESYIRKLGTIPQRTFDRAARSAIALGARALRRTAPVQKTIPRRGIGARFQLKRNIFTRRGKKGRRIRRFLITSAPQGFWTDEGTKLRFRRRIKTRSGKYKVGKFPTGKVPKSLWAQNTVASVRDRMINTAVSRTLNIIRKQRV